MRVRRLTFPRSAGPGRSSRRALTGPLAVLGALLLVCLGASPALAAEGSIDHVESGSGSTEVIFSVPGLPDPTALDFASVAVSFQGQSLPATAASAADGTLTVKRTAILAIDNSQSMEKENRFPEAQNAARSFLDVVPDDVYVGIVTFNGSVVLQQEPSLDRAASRDIINGLTTDKGTLLYEGVAEATQAAGQDGQRSVLLVTDGKDESNADISIATEAAAESGVKVDVVSIGTNQTFLVPLREIAEAGQGEVFANVDPATLSQVFAAEAQVLAQQVVVTVDTTDIPAGTEGTLQVSLDASGETYTDTAFVTLSAAAETAPEAVTPSAPSPPGEIFGIPQWAMVVGLIGLGVGAFFLVLGINGLLSPREQTLQERIAQYTRSGAGNRHSSSSQAAFTKSAVDLADKALGGSKGFQALLASKIEGGALTVQPGEWLLIHAGIALGAGVVGMLLFPGNPMLGIVLFALGVIGPWIFLSTTQSRRVKAFKAQLADTLQLMGGSLSAGMSLLQAVDNIVKEGPDPMAAEFKRAVVDARLGQPIEDGLEAISVRMQSQDFSWVVMAIRIQRDVGGNLAELLNSVADTIREREFLERQVQALSAEGRLSVWILGGLAPGFMLYLMVANPTYLAPFFTTFLGNLLLAVMATLLTVGIVWMRKLVKVSV